MTVRAEKNGSRCRATRWVAVLLCALPLLAGCAASGAGVPAVTAPPTLAPPPAVPATTPLPDQLHLRPIAPDTLALFVQPDDGRAPVLNAFNNAQTSIDLMIYLLSDQEVIAALKNAARRGVAVRVLLEQNPCCSDNNTAQRALFNELQAARVQMQWTNPAFRLTHAKMSILDGATALIMSQNLTKSSFTFNREASVVDRDPVDVAALKTLFAADWERSPYTPTDPNLIIANSNARQMFLTLIGGATQSLAIESEEMQDPAIIDALVAARKRGVIVRYIGATTLAGTTPPQRDGNAAGRKRLTGGGASVRLLAAPYVHTKTVVADGSLAFVGSENFSAASLDTNREIGILLTDSAILDRLTSVFTKDWVAGKSET
ncbi:MAG: phospholipase D-like domain-containing protein [Thermomicrobia bacterium]|nr:phospholipase D-like domain-containing protein [Thermomicrobia bacterium]